MNEMRLDKWLWAARFFKTRRLATDAVDGGKVKLNGQRIKPAKEVRIGDLLVVQLGDNEWVLTIRALSERRGPAEAARALYEEDPASRVKRQARIADKRLIEDPAAKLHGRPTKRDRRALGRVKGRG